MSAPERFPAALARWQAWPVAASSLVAVYLGFVLAPTGAEPWGVREAAALTVAVAGLVALVGAVLFVGRPDDGLVVAVLLGLTLVWVPRYAFRVAVFQELGPPVARAVAVEPYRSATLLCLGLATLAYQLKRSERADERDDAAPAAESTTTPARSR